MTRDRLFIVKPGFADPAFPGQVFYCWHCALMEGLIASFPAALGSIDIERIEWPRPRQAVIDMVGPDHQNLPLLVLADDAPAGLETGQYQGRRFVQGKDEILRAISFRCGIPDPHP
ncbi:MAG: DUF3088 domain-containing protein [Brevundimonas sp.]